MIGSEIHSHNIINEDLRRQSNTLSLKTTHLTLTIFHNMHKGFIVNPSWLVLTVLLYQMLKVFIGDMQPKVLIQTGAELFSYRLE